MRPEDFIKGRVSQDEFMRDGNAFALMGVTRRALVAAGNDPHESQAYVASLMQGNYDELLAGCLAVLELTDPDDEDDDWDYDDDYYDED